MLPLLQIPLDHLNLFLTPVGCALRTSLFTLPIRNRSVMTRSDRIIVCSARNLTRKLLQSLPLRLRNEECGEETAQHEEGKNLHHVIKPRRLGRAGWCTLLTQRAEDTLSDYGSNFARGSRYAVRGRAVACWEAFSGNDERGCIRA